MKGHANLIISYLVFVSLNVDIGRGLLASAFRATHTQQEQRWQRRARKASLLPSTRSSEVAFICSDVDGTLLTPNHECTKRTVSAVLEAMDGCGVGFAACTGRGRAGAYAVLGPILGHRLKRENTAGVFLNGVLVYGPGGVLVSESRVAPEVVSLVADFVEYHRTKRVDYHRPTNHRDDAENDGGDRFERSGLNISLVAFSFDRILCEKHDEWTDLIVKYKEPRPEAVVTSWHHTAKQQAANNDGEGVPLHKLIILGHPDQLERLRPLLADHISSKLGDDAAELTQAVPTMLEILPKGCSKGAGVEALLDYLSIDPSTVFAIGDAENDIGMLKLCGVSVAMGNAAPAVKAAASSSTPKEPIAARAMEQPQQLQQGQQHVIERLVTLCNSNDGAALAIERHVIS
mmetsp:Transcript_13377/g.27297  ORF Transcript_13377/g.27297 Transcript_13377/m.27297 type:complete len:403 (-) Transcript_13377:89-1297(-)